MAYIRLVDPDDASGPLKAELDAARARAGRIWNVVGIMSPNPAVLRASMQLYRALLYGASPLTRRQREMLAVLTSAANHCRY